MRIVKYVLLMLGLTALFIGCGQNTQTDSTPSVRSLSELMVSLTSDAEDFSFCLSEEAGIQSLKQSSDKMKATLGELPDAITASDLSESEKQSLANEIEKLNSSCNDLTNSVVGNDSTSKLSKSNKAISDEIKRIRKKYSIK